jgi:putative membrane protein
MATVLAQMWDHDGGGGHMGGGWWWVMGIGWLVFLAAIVVIVVLFMRRSDHRGADAARSGPENVLAERLARGEIDEDEYRRRRDALRS